MEEKWRWTLDESGSNEKKDGGRLKREWRGRRREGEIERERDGGGIARSVHHSQS